MPTKVRPSLPESPEIAPPTVSELGLTMFTVGVALIVTAPVPRFSGLLPRKVKVPIHCCGLLPASVTGEPLVLSIVPPLMLSVPLPSVAAVPEILRNAAPRETEATDCA